MEYIIREMKEEDKSDVFKMMKVFYSSPAVLSNGSDEIFNADIDNCVGDSPYLEGYVFESKEKLIGYAMLAKSFSTEYGRPCIWIEDLYLKDDFRGMGVGGEFFEYIGKKYKDVIFRLEVEEENQRAIHVYAKAGFDILPYTEMKKL